MKLAARSRDLPGLTRLLASRADAASPDCVRLVSTYFDTADRTLAGQGLSLRVRERNGRFVQTVKSADSGDAAALARGEWEDPIGTARPDPEAPNSGRFVARAAARPLIPLYRTAVERRTLPLTAATATRIEAAIDRGRVETLSVPASERISEVELELKRGDPAALYDLALDLLAVAPVRIERRSKSARGARLAGPPPPPQAVHAAPVDLDPAMPGHQALRRIGLSCLQQIAQNEEAVLAALPDGIHQMRVGVRRLRAILSAFAGLLPEDRRRWASEELGWLGNSLGGARNLDVFASDIMAPVLAALGAIGGSRALTQAVARRRAAACDEAAHAIGSTRYTGLMLRLLCWFEGNGWGARPGNALDAPIGELADAILKRRLAVVMRRSARFAGQSAEQRHALRIALKKLRYAIEMLGALYEPERVDRDLKLLKQLQQGLGAANDLRVARDLVAELQEPGGSGMIAAAGAAVLAWHAQQQSQPDAKLAKLIGQLRRGSKLRSD